MGWCYSVFKIVVICMLLVSFGVGYLKVYQLFVDIKDTLASVDEADSIKDLAWIPFLVLQICTTIFIFLQIYCLIRELCEDSYMYNRCFTFAFVLTVLIYCISVIPKSILTIIYHNFDVTIEEWWNKIVDVLQSLFASLGMLGFQVILYRKLIKKLLKSAGVCKKREVYPEHSEEDNERFVDDESDVDKNGCCIFAKRKQGKRSTESTRHIADKKETLTNNVSKVSTWSDNKRKQVRHMTNKRKDAIITKVKSNPRTQDLINRKKEMDKKVFQAKLYAKQKTENLTKQAQRIRKLNVVSQAQGTTDIYCSECGPYKSRTIATIENMDTIKDKTIDNKSPTRECKTCGKVLNHVAIQGETNSDKSASKIKVCCRQFEDKICCLCKNRKLCLIITTVLASLHMLVFVVEIIFIFCPWCK